jgi:hypothetical protein
MDLFANVSHELSGIGLSFFDGTDSLRMLIDRDLTRKVLLHLLSNAMKFTPKDSSIIVELSQALESEFSSAVRGKGIGFPGEPLSPADSTALKSSVGLDSSGRAAVCRYFYSERDGLGNCRSFGCRPMHR